MGCATCACTFAQLWTKNKCMIKNCSQNICLPKNTRTRIFKPNYIRPIRCLVRLFHLDAGSQDELFWGAESLSEGEVRPSGLWQSGRGRTFLAISTVDSRQSVGRDWIFLAIFNRWQSGRSFGHFPPFQQLTVGGGEIGHFPPFQQLTVGER